MTAVQLSKPVGTARRLGGVGLALVGTSALLWLTNAIGQQKAESLERYVLYQVLTLAVAAIVVLGVRLLVRSALPRVGMLNAPARRIKALSVAEGEGWRRVGTTFAVIISLVTAVFLWFGYSEQLAGIGWRSWLLAFLIAVPLSATNALTEELITRWAVVASLAGRWDRLAPWVSAAVFGSVHYFGIPGGPIGALMAGFLGWLLARSIQDTRGIGWAWIVHFCQDMLIFTVTLALFI